MAVIRNAGGRFGKGTAPGPGRPPGSGPAARLRSHLGDEKIAKAVDKLYELALDGDTAALRMLMDRLYPVQDSRVEELRDAIAELRARLDERRAS